MENTGNSSPRPCIASTSRTQKVWLKEGNRSKRYAKPSGAEIVDGINGDYAASLSCRFTNKRCPFSFNHRAIDRDLGDIVTTRRIEHHIEHDALEQARNARAPVPLRTASIASARKASLVKVKPDTVHRHQFGILLHHGVLRIGQNHTATRPRIRRPEC